jgi:hypothetical protein
MEVQLKSDSGGRAEPIARFHHDDDKAYRGVVEAHVRAQGWKDTHTGGYNPNANAKAEVRIGMLKQLFKVVLLCCTGGVLYYEQLWDVGLVYCNRVLNSRKWSDRDSPIARLTGLEVPRNKHWHTFGAYCVYHIPPQNRQGPYRPPGEMGIWVGLDPHVEGGHWVVPIEWDSEQQAWILHEVRTATTVRVYDEVLPLRLKPKKGRYGSQEFDNFTEAVFHPLIEHMLASDEQEVTPEVESQPCDQPATDSEPEPEPDPELEPDQSEVETIVARRERGHLTQYKVKWKGWNHRYDCWRDASDLYCQDLIDEFNAAAVSLDLVAGVKDMHALNAELQGSLASIGLEGVNVSEAVKRLASRQLMPGDPSDYEEGYVKELQHMLKRRLRLLDPVEEARVRREHSVVSLRMLLEAKKDGRRKARLILQGFKEPKSWDVDSNASPVAFPSTIKSLLFMGGEADDIISSIDISVAFLQSREYGPDDPPRYVTYRPYSGGKESVYSNLEVP